MIVQTVIATLSGAVRWGCNSPEALANAVHLGRETSRIDGRKKFEKVRHHIQAGKETELFERTLERISNAHLVAMFNDDD